MDNNKLTDNPTFVICVVLFLFISIGIPAFYNANKELFNTIVLEMSLFNIGFFTHFSQKAVENYQTIQALKPYDMNWKEVSLVLHYTGLWVRFPFAFILILIGLISILYSRKSNLYRKFSMKKLTEHNKEHFPCITPIVGRGEYLQDVKSFDNGHWKIARTSAQFCVENKLVTYEDNKEILWEEAFQNGMANSDMQAYGKMILHKERFEEVFTKQLGDKRRDFYLLPPIRKVMAAAFLAYGNDDKKTAIKLLDICSRTYFEDEKQATCSCLEDSNFMQEVCSVHEKHQQNTQSKLINKHTLYELPYFMALLYFARKKGILAPSQFLFLRPIDRPLWYALHQCGGQVAWAESLAPWLHYQEEEKKEKPLQYFVWENAYIFIKNDLDAQGWLKEDLVNEQKKA